jgi:hypothetical protein
MFKNAECEQSAVQQSKVKEKSNITERSCFIIILGDANQFSPSTRL